MNYVVRSGGFIMLDDTQLYSVNELANCCVSSPVMKWRLEVGRVVIFRKTTGQRELPEFSGQPYIVERT